MNQHQRDRGQLVGHPPGTTELDPPTGRQEVAATNGWVNVEIRPPPGAQRNCTTGNESIGTTGSVPPALVDTASPRLASTGRSPPDRKPGSPAHGSGATRCGRWKAAAGPAGTGRPPTHLDGEEEEVDVPADLAADVRRVRASTSRRPWVRADRDDEQPRPPSSWIRPTRNSRGRSSPRRLRGRSPWRTARCSRPRRRSEARYRSHRWRPVGCAARHSPANR